MWKVFENPTVTKQDVDVSLKADVLVVGGSISGCWAALMAKRNGANNVVICEKGFVGRAGVVAQASGSGAYLIPGADEYNEKLIHSRHKAAEDMDNLDFIRYVFTESYQIALELQKLGFKSRAEGINIGEIQTNLLAFDGSNALLFFRKLLLSVGVVILDYSPALELLQNSKGQIVGANGVNTQTKSTWSVFAAAVILATGGNAFRSGAMGTNHTTGDGHLFAAEAGAKFSGMEFSCHYGISPQGSETTKGFWLSSATFYDGTGQEIAGNGWESVHLVGKAILETGRAYASMNKSNKSVKAYAKGIPSIYQYFQKKGIDPYTEKFPIELRYEGYIRSVGGIVIDEYGNTGVAGLYAVGDVTERSKMSGASMSGAGPAIAWCLVSANMAGKHAAIWAQENPIENKNGILGLAEIGLRGKEAKSFNADRLIQSIQNHVLPIEKNLFRSVAKVHLSIEELDALWDENKFTLAASSVQQAVVAREAAAMLLDARMMLHSASRRLETRGLHRLIEYPQKSTTEKHHLLVSGLQYLDIKAVKQRPNAQAN